jgi:hypothetical protein
MLVIRQEQMEVFRTAALRTFEDEMVGHLAGFSPPLFQAIGEVPLRNAIRLGTERAATYGFTLRGPVRLYLELMLLFGSQFDTDPQYPWATKILADRDSSPQMGRAECLYERSMDYRKSVAGPEDAYTLNALRHIAVLARQPLTLPMEDFAAAMLREIAFVYPEKAAYVGNQGVSALIRKGMDGARRQRFATPRGMALVILLMFAMGHGCGSDPLYPWIAQTLRDEAVKDPDAKATRLEKKALTWLEHVLANFDKGRQA